jgi:hypothetical protein
MESIFGGLIQFESDNEFDEFMRNMGGLDSLKIIETAIEYAYQNNVYTQQETYCIYKSLKKLKEYENQTSGLRDDDTHGDIN